MFGQMHTELKVSFIARASHWMRALGTGLLI